MSAEFTSGVFQSGSCCAKALTRLALEKRGTLFAVFPLRPECQRQAT
jgi:hypothetical protein